MEYVNLNNGVKMPSLGLGTFQMTDPLECEQSVLRALNLGYRLIDTAAAYGNEVAIGKAVKKSGIARNELFITSKLWIQDVNYEGAKLAFEKTLEKLQLDYLDLYLIHQPYNDVYGAWRAMEELYEDGRIRAIGISNFYPSKFIDFLMNVKIKPSINQVELHPFYHEKDQKEIASEFKTNLQAWAPLAEAKSGLNSNPTLLEIGENHNKTPAQVALKWNIQNGIAVIPKAVTESHLEDNINIFDFSLTKAEIRLINALDTNQSLFNEKTNPKVTKNMNSWKIY